MCPFTSNDSAPQLNFPKDPALDESGALSPYLHPLKEATLLSASLQVSFLAVVLVVDGHCSKSVSSEGLVLFNQLLSSNYILPLLPTSRWLCF